MLLQDLSYEFEAGNIYHLNGVNGAGKSTLAKILTGVLKPSSGKIYLGNSPYDAYRFPGKVVGYSFQNPDEQIFSSTVKDEILAKEILKENKNVELGESMFAAFALSNFAEKHPSEMPFVIRKRIALAATLANEREWYILDEPTLGQDQRNVEEITKLIKQLALNGKGIILVSHSEQFVSTFENAKTITLKSGKIIS
jgi:energy-coupling factor transport system ATP-binding protein